MITRRSVIARVFSAVLLAVTLLVPAVLGQTAGVGEGAATPTLEQGMAEQTGISWRDIVKSGGSLMYVLAAMSVLAVAFIIYFLVVLRSTAIAPRGLQRDLVDKIRSGALDEARRLCESHACPLSAVALAAIDHMRAVPDAESFLLKDVIQDVGTREADGIQGQTQYLMDIAVIAPMVGFLGTVIGMLRAFSAVALDIAKAKPMLLAAGVSQALVTTVFGLIIAIPSMAFYAYFRRRASRLVAHLEGASSEMLTALLSKRTS